jgi:DNA-directed RNA polymerase specialized sigma24 family protein
VGATKSVLADAELVDRVRRGDVESFGELCRRYERSVLAVALAQLRDIHAAEDVAQATLLAGFQRLSTLTDSSKFGPWILQIARRQVIDLARRRKPAPVSRGRPGTGHGNDDPSAAVRSSVRPVLRMGFRAWRSGAPQMDLEELWRVREEDLYPALFGPRVRGIFPLQVEMFTGQFGQSKVDPRWLRYRGFEFRAHRNAASKAEEPPNPQRPIGRERENAIRADSGTGKETLDPVSESDE